MHAEAKKKAEDKVKLRLILYAVLTVIAPPVGILFLVGSLLSSLKKKGAESRSPARPQRPVQWDSRQDNGKKSHGHTPMEYSYDSCAVDRRMEQLDVLYKAGLYTKEQYRAAKAKILGK